MRCLLTFADFFEEILAFQARDDVPSAVQRRLVVEEIVGQLQAGGALSHFMRGEGNAGGFMEGILAFIAELQRNDVTAAQLSTAVAGAANLKDRDSAGIYADYQTLLSQHDWHDGDERPRPALVHLERGHWQPFAGIRAVFVDGFTDFARVQLERSNFWPMRRRTVD